MSAIWETVKCIVAIVVGVFFFIFAYLCIFVTPNETFVVGLFLVLLANFCFAYVPASVAVGKGHSYGKWYLYAFLFWPIAMIHSLIITDYESDYKECPYCAERVKKAAKVCRYCGRELTAKLATQR